jgi:hypothetical protein
VQDKGGVLGSIADAPENYATQAANCFAFDNCVDDESGPQWTDGVGSGNAVSPDNMLFWNVYPPPHEHIVYRQGRFRRPFTWHAAFGTSCISGQVTDVGNKPVPGATVTIIGLQRRDGEDTSTQTDANGNFQFQGVPILSNGQYLISAQKQDPNLGFEEGSIRVTVVANMCVPAPIPLEPPNQRFRQVIATGTIHVDEQGDESDPGQDTINGNCLVNSADPANNLPPNPNSQMLGGQNSCVDGLRATVGAQCHLNDDNSVTLHVASTLIEFDACDDIENPHTYDGRPDDQIVVPAGGGVDYNLHLRNEFNDEWADYHLHFVNKCQDCP